MTKNSVLPWSELCFPPKKLTHEKFILIIKGNLHYNFIMQFCIKYIDIVALSKTSIWKATGIFSFSFVLSWKLQMVVKYFVE